MSNLIDDISKLSTIPEKTLSKLISKSQYCICESVKEDIELESDYTEIFIGLGKLYIKYDFQNDKVKYKFEPSEELNKNILDTYKNKSNLLQNTLNQALVKKFMDVYKDLC